MNELVAQVEDLIAVASECTRLGATFREPVSAVDLDVTLADVVLYVVDMVAALRDAVVLVADRVSALETRLP